MMMIGKENFMFLITFLLMAQTVGNADVEDIKRVKDIPRNEKEHNETISHMNCPFGEVPMFLLHGTAETVLGCFKDEYINGHYCPEINGEKVQARFNASCQNFTVTPCGFRYKASEGWKYYECFEKHGGIETLRGKIAKLELENAALRKERERQTDLIEKIEFEKAGLRKERDRQTDLIEKIEFEKAALRKERDRQTDLIEKIELEKAVLRKERDRLRKERDSENDLISGLTTTVVMESLLIMFFFLILGMAKRNFYPNDLTYSEYVKDLCLFWRKKDRNYTCTCKRQNKSPNLEEHNESNNQHCLYSVLPDLGNEEETHDDDIDAASIYVEEEIELLNIGATEIDQ